MFRPGIIILSLTFLVTSCGEPNDGTRGVWVNPRGNLTQDTNDRNPLPEAENKLSTSYTVELMAIHESLGNLSGIADVTVNETDAMSVTKMFEMPQSLIVGQRSITNKPCSEIGLTSIPEIINVYNEYKEVKFVENASRETLVAELNLLNRHNGDKINLEGKQFVIKAYISNTNSPASESTALFPIACGTLYKTTSDNVASEL